MLVIGISLAAPMLELMGTPEEVLDQACLYMRIYFIGMPASMLYNFGAAILRAVGDTQRPLYFLFLAGIINVVLNLFFVIGFHLDVAGVAIATVISQCVSAGLVLLCLVKSHTPYRVDLRRLGLKKDKLWGMVKIGLPAGIQGCSFSISNVLIQSSINSFGAMAMAGNTAASNIEGFVSTAQDAFCPGGPELYRPEYGRGEDPAGQPHFAAVPGAGYGHGGWFWAQGPFCWATSCWEFTRPTPQVIAFGIRRMSICCVLQFVGGLMGVMVGVLRGHGLLLHPHGHHHWLCVRLPCHLDLYGVRDVPPPWRRSMSPIPSPGAWPPCAMGCASLIVHRHVSKKTAPCNRGAGVI